jgi:hypothetical protein
MAAICHLPPKVSVPDRLCITNPKGQEHKHRKRTGPKPVPRAFLLYRHGKYFALSCVVMNRIVRGLAPEHQAEGIISLIHEAVEAAIPFRSEKKLRIIYTARMLIGLKGEVFT